MSENDNKPVYGIPVPTTEENLTRRSPMFRRCRYFGCHTSLPLNDKQIYCFMHCCSVFDCNEAAMMGSLWCFSHRKNCPSQPKYWEDM
jgi:hypothetical protein